MATEHASTSMASSESMVDRAAAWVTKNKVRRSAGCPRRPRLRGGAACCWAAAGGGAGEGGKGRVARARAGGARRRRAHLTAPPTNPLAQLKAVFYGWGTVVAGSLAYQWTRPIPTSLKIIHSRVYAQAATLGALAAVAAVETYNAGRKSAEEEGKK